MILEKLYEYYMSHQDLFPAENYEFENIHFCLVYDDDGNIVRIEDLRIQRGKKQQPKKLRVPGLPQKRTSNNLSNFLWDNTQYIFGFPKNKDFHGNKENARQRHLAFKELHQKLLQSLDQKEVTGFLNFLKKWTPPESEEEFLQQLKNLDYGEELIDCNLVFRHKDSVKQYLHDLPEMKTLWNNYCNDEPDTETAVCMVTGKPAKIAKLHPPIKGVRGGQASGASLVSFNLDAFTSYGKNQNLNAPISLEAAAAYTSAMNHLLNSPRNHVTIHEFTYLFWSHVNNRMEDVFGFILSSQQLEKEQDQRISDFLNAVKVGRAKESDIIHEDRDKPFYLLGMMPNSSRISIRLWYQSTIGDLAENLQDFYADLAVLPEDSRYGFPTVENLLFATVSENIPVANRRNYYHPQLEERLVLSLVQGQPFPFLLLSTVINAIRADHKVNFIRTMLVKGYLVRYFRYKKQKKEVPMSLDVHCNETGYLLGRLFATLEKIQQDALGGDINATIADRYFASASSTPASVFPYLIRLSKHHLSKLSGDNKGLFIHREKIIQDIMEKLTGFPAHLNLHDQGWFVLGYYHQKNEFYKKSEN